MSVIVSNIITSQAAVAAQTTYFTCPTSTKVIIDKMTATNTAAVAATVSLNLVNSGGGADAANLITAGKVIPPGDVYQFSEVAGHILQAGQFISILSSATTVTLRASGRIVT